MSETGDARPPAPPASRGYRLANGVMMFFGACFLLPGLCSLCVIVATAIEEGGSPFSHPYAPAFAIVWVLCFAISAIGVWMIVAARERRRAVKRARALR
jgi:hypothetical protein